MCADPRFIAVDLRLLNLGGGGIECGGDRLLKTMVSVWYEFHGGAPAVQHSGGGKVALPSPDMYYSKGVEHNHVAEVTTNNPPTPPR